MLTTYYNINIIVSPLIKLFYFGRWMYNEHRKERREKEVVAIKDDEKKPGVLKKKNSLDFRLSSHDFDLKTILDRRTQTHRGSGQFSSFGLDNIAFQMEEGVRAKASPED